MKTSDPEFRSLYPFASRYVRQGGLRQHYVDEGQGRPVVMVHGNPTWSFFYRDMIKRLAPQFRCIAPDHIGCGFSDKPQDYPYTLKTHIDNLEHLLDDVLFAEWPDATMDLVVHDWGGAIGLGYAVRHPARIRKIVVLNTAAFLDEHLPWRINLCRTPVLGEWLIRGLNAFAACATRMTTVRPMPRAVREGFVLPYDNWATRIATLRFVQDIPMHRGIPSWPVLEEIEVRLAELANKPMLLQWGARDWCFSTHFFEEFRKRFPQAEHDLYDEAGHYLLEDAGDRILPRVRHWLSGGTA